MKDTIKSSHIGWLLGQGECEMKGKQVVTITRNGWLDPEPIVILYTLYLFAEHMDSLYIVFIWDEFTEYFKNNQNNITGLQEIAMASSRISCYFFLITHSSASQLIQDKGSKTISEARFKLDTIELEESTAFKLLGQALRHEPDLLDEWNHTCEQLWDGVKRNSVDVIKNKDITVQDDDFRNLMPIPAGAKLY